jgi:hypothetical protein
VPETADVRVAAWPQLLALPGLLASFGGGWLRAPADTWGPWLSAALSPYPHPSSLASYFPKHLGFFISAGVLIHGNGNGRRGRTTLEPGFWSLVVAVSLLSLRLCLDVIGFTSIHVYWCGLG